MITTQPMQFHVSPNSTNKKTGNMLVTTSSKNTCPDSCQHKRLNSCYASFSFLGLHWNKVSNGSRSQSWDEVIKSIRNQQHGIMWRWAQAGDLPGIDGEIDKVMLADILWANMGKKGFAYTHKPVNTNNISLIRKAIANGFTINISCDSFEEVTRYRTYFPDIPLVVTVPYNHKRKQTLPGIDLVSCPAEIKGSDISCTTCGLCAVPDRKSVIMFHAHGSRKHLWKEKQNESNEGFVLSSN